MDMDKDFAGNLLDLPEFEPERRRVRLPRLGLEWVLQEVPYDRVMRCRRERDPNLFLILEATVSPNLRDKAWYEGRMGCPTPVDALKKQLRVGELDKLVRVIDRLNGYGAGSVLELSDEELEAQTLGAALEHLEKN